MVSLTDSSTILSVYEPVNASTVTHTATLTSTACDVPTRTGSTTSNLVTIEGLEAGVEYSITVTGTNLMAQLTGTGVITITTKEASKFVFFSGNSNFIILKLIAFRLKKHKFKDINEDKKLFAKYNK